VSKRPFEQVVADHGVAILRCCRALVGPIDGDDAWSETFLAALRADPAHDDGANVEAWLVTIAHRKAIDIVRARDRRPVTMPELPEPRLASAKGLDVTDHDLWAAVRALPDKQRQSVAYHYLVGLPYAEIAGIVGGTTEAARRAAADGIHHLRRTFDDSAVPKGRTR
jgi:RNA polymerase sigma factor (sigma-70 family)